MPTVVDESGGGGTGIITQVRIANMALSFMGSTVQISAMTDASTEAEQCSLHYDAALDLALERIDWDFARRRLLLTAATVDVPDPWAYAYIYPTLTTLIVIRRIDDGLVVRPSELRTNFSLETMEDGTRLLYCDVSPATLIYTHRTTDPTLYPWSFAKFVARMLAAELARSLAKDENLARSLMQIQEIDFGHAATRNFRNEQEPIEPEASWIRDR